MRKTLAAGVGLAGLLLSVALTSQATVEIAKKEKGTKCTTCHVKMGAKELNAAGKYYAQHRTRAGYPPPEPAKPAAPPKPAATPKPPPPPAPPAEKEEMRVTPERQLYLVIREKPYPEKAQEYEAMFREWVAAAQEVNLSEEFAWQVVQKEPLSYSFIIPLMDLAELDPASAPGQARHQKLKAAFGEQRFQELVARTHGTFETAELFVVESLPEWSYRPASAAGAPEAGMEAKRPRFVHVDMTRVRFDKADAYLAVMKQFYEMGRQLNFPFVVSAYRTLTGPANTYFHVIEATDHKELAELHRFFEEEYSKAAADAESWQKLQAEWTSCVASFEHYDETIRYDLSYLPVAEKK